MKTELFFRYIIFVLFITIILLSCDEEETETPVEEPIETINAFIIDEQGAKLMGTDKGLYVLITDTKSYNMIASGIDPAPIDDIANFTKENSNDLWMASIAGAVNYNTQVRLTSSNSGLVNSNVYHLNFDMFERSYFATPDGISIIHNTKWFTNIGTDSLFLKYEITDMATASNGYTYATTHGGGVERFTLDVDGITGATVFDTDWTQLKSNNVLTVFIDDTVQAYGTDAGVAFHYSEYTKWDWENYTITEGLINDTVLSIIKDRSDNWWFGTTQGLSMFNGTEWFSFTIESHALISNEIKFLALDLDGSIWIATDMGLSHYINEQWINYPIKK